jgi:hypothetical protein
MFPTLTALPLAEQAKRFLSAPEFRPELGTYQRARLVHECWGAWVDPASPWPSPWAIAHASGYETPLEPSGRRFGYIVRGRKRQVVLDADPDWRVPGFMLAVALVDIALAEHGGHLDRWWGALELLAAPASLVDFTSAMDFGVRQPHLPAEVAAPWWYRCRAVNLWSDDGAPASSQVPARLITI